MGAERAEGLPHEPPRVHVADDRDEVRPVGIDQPEERERMPVLAFNVDAHFDVRADTPRNSGTPYRELLEGGHVEPQRLHQIGSQMPPQVWMAIDRKAWKPRVTGTPIRVVRFSGAALTQGVEKHQIEGVTVRVYCPAKTVADCFKYRNKIGLDVALEALEECRRSRKCSNDDLWRFGKICRVEHVMRPYMEVIR